MPKPRERFAACASRAFLASQAASRLLTANNPNFLTPFFDQTIVLIGIKELSLLEGGIVTEFAAAIYCMVIAYGFITINTRRQARYN